MSPYKLVVTVPEEAGDALRQATGNAGGGKIGNYSHCSFTIKGTGRFTPQKGAEPVIGAVGESEEVVEERVEVGCTENSLKSVVQAIKDTHPYRTSNRHLPSARVIASA